VLHDNVVVIQGSDRLQAEGAGIQD